MTEGDAMERAIEIATRGWGRVAPNPLVGAVLLREGRVVAEGFHAEFGRPHAEAAALAACDDPAGTTCVVNLEPCVHQGKTPPCTRALIEAGVARVVVAVRDPDEHGGGGIEELRHAGIQIQVGTGAAAAAALNAPFLWSRHRPDRPFVAVKLATSLDGFIADRRGRSQWISGPEAREYVHWLRAGFDAIGVGHRTVVADDPRLTVRGPVTPRIAPTRVVFARGGAVAPDRELMRTADQTPTRIVGDGGLRSALETLRAEGIRSILIEGGATLAGALQAEGLVDRVYWIQAPIWLGDGVSAFSTIGCALEDAQPWAVTERRTLGVDTLLVVDRELCLLAS